MIHKCSICGKTKDCHDEECEQPEVIAMNCGVDTGKPFHEEEYIKTTKGSGT